MKTSPGNKALQPANELWTMYHPELAPFAFRAKTPVQARSWQAKTRRALEALVGFQEPVRTSLKPRLLERKDKGDYIREKILLQTAPGVEMPVYILLPKAARRPMPIVLAFNGHGYGVKDIVGIWEDGSDRDTVDGYQKDFGVALCRAGFAVAAPEISCFGERQTDFSYLDGSMGQCTPTTCTHTSFLAFHLGKSALGMRMRDGKRLIDYLETRREMDSRRIGAMGISGGGMHTFFFTCLEPRVKACVVSGYYCTFRDSILAMSHCTCNVVPGLWQFGEMQDLVGLIAPRPMLVEAGSRDPIFPIASVKNSVRRAHDVYRVFGVKDEPEADYFEGRHQISGRKAYPFLQRCLME